MPGHIQIYILMINFSRFFFLLWQETLTLLKHLFANVQAAVLALFLFDVRNIFKKLLSNNEKYYTRLNDGDFRSIFDS